MKERLTQLEQEAIRSVKEWDQVKESKSAMARFEYLSTLLRQHETYWYTKHGILTEDNLERRKQLTTIGYRFHYFLKYNPLKLLFLKTRMNIFKKLFEDKRFPSSTFFSWYMQATNAYLVFEERRTKDKYYTPYLKD